jgi:hypothetical protein
MAHTPISRHGRDAGRRPRSLRRSAARLALVLVVGSALAGGAALFLTAPSQGLDGRTLPLPIGATEGYGESTVLGFTYPQQFFCTADRLDDLDGPGHTGDGTVAAEDPDEFQHPAMGPPGSPCIVGATRPNPVGGSLPAIQPNGEGMGEAEKLWAILPFFDGNTPPNGIVDAFDPAPGVDVQCREPGPPTTTHTGLFGTCTMHPSTLHAEPVVATILRGLVCGANVPTSVCPVGSTTPTGDIPLPNHSHIIDGTDFHAIWWQTIAVRVFDRAIWPDTKGACPANPAGGAPCLTSLAALRAAQATPFAGNPLGNGFQAAPDTPSNVWLFFDAQPVIG